MTGVGDLIFYASSPSFYWRRLWRLLVPQAWQQKRFVILTFPRSGTNLLCGLLYRHPQILMHTELFNPIEPYTYPAGRKVLANWDVEARDEQNCGVGYIKAAGLTTKRSSSSVPQTTISCWRRHPDEFTRCVWENVPRAYKAVGFKIFPEHFEGHERTFDEVRTA